MKKIIWSAVLYTMCTGLLHAGASPEDADLVKSQVLSENVTERDADSNSGRFFDFYASDKAAQLRYERDGDLIKAEQARLSLSFLISEQRDNLFTLGLAIDTEPQLIPGVRLSFGGKVYAALLGQENSDISSLAIGLEANYELPVEKLPLVLDASIYYAPDVLTFGDADRIIDWELNAGLRLRKSIVGYVGFRFLQADTRPGDRELDDRVHLGFRWELGNS